MRWYKHDPAAFLEGVIGLSAEERGFYITLIDLQYARAPNSDVTDELVIRAMACHPRLWRRVKAGLIVKGKVHETAGKLTANRVVNQVQTYLNKRTIKGVFRGQNKENQGLSERGADQSAPGEYRIQNKKDPSDLSKPRKRAKTPFPDGWEPPLDLTERTEFAKFRASALAHGRVYANWEQAWRNWKLNAPNFAPARSVTQRNRETMDELNSFIDQCAADAGSRRPPDAQGHLLLPDSKSDGAQGISERTGEPARDILGRRGNGRGSQSNGSKP